MRKDYIPEDDIPEDDIPENDNPEDDNPEDDNPEDDIAQALREIRENTIRKLRDSAETVNVTYQKYAGRNIKANAAGLAGGVLATAGGALAFATGGLAAPAVVTALSATSGGASLAGGGLSVKNAYDREKEFEDIHRRLWAIVEEDERKVREKLHEIIHRQNLRDGSLELDPAQLISGVMAIADFLNAAENNINCRAIKEMLRGLPSIINIISHGGFPILAGLVVPCVNIPVIASSINKKLEKVMVNTGATASTATAGAKMLSSETAEEGAKKLLEATLKEVGEEVAGSATKKVAMEATEEGAKSVSTQLAKNGAAAGAKITAKVAGAVAMTFGGISIVWEGINLIQNYRATKAESEHAKELLRLADILEKSL